jgi:hypothetical protein
VRALRRSDPFSLTKRSGLISDAEDLSPDVVRPRRPDAGRRPGAARHPGAARRVALRSLPSWAHQAHRPCPRPGHQVL